MNDKLKQTIVGGGIGEISAVNVFPQKIAKKFIRYDFVRFSKNVLPFSFYPINVCIHLQELDKKSQYMHFTRRVSPSSPLSKVDYS